MRVRIFDRVVVDEYFARDRVLLPRRLVFESFSFRPTSRRHFDAKFSRRVSRSLGIAKCRTIALTKETLPASVPVKQNFSCRSVRIAVTSESEASRGTLKNYMQYAFGDCPRMRPKRIKFIRHDASQKLITRSARFQRARSIPLDPCARFSSIFQRQVPSSSPSILGLSNETWPRREDAQFTRGNSRFRSPRPRSKKTKRGRHTPRFLRYMRRAIRAQRCK